jgi:hypothetical protein
MQYVKDDMDELFRRAAEDYSLDTKGADWNKVAALLQDEGGQQPAGKKRDKRQLLWLLCLLPIGLLCNKLLLHGPGGSGMATGQGKPAASAAAATDQSTTAYHKRAEEHQGDNGLSAGVKAPAGSLLAAGALPVFHSSAGKRYLKNIDQYKYGTSINTSMQDPVPAVADIDALNATVDKGLSRFTGPVSITEKAKHSLPALSPMHEAIVKNTPQLSAQPQKKFYAVLMGGIDASTVKMQRTDHVGHHYGVLAGYRLGSKLSVEAGLLSDRKYYYTDGKYFNTEHLYMPANSKITEVTGDCRMLEIPINLKYDLSSNARSSWFVSAGVSSYFMKREHYDYLYYYGTSGTQASYYKTYANSSKNLFSIIQISGGYTSRIGRSTAFRIEPYLKIPTAGIGFGKLPLLSTGMNIAVIRELW